MKNSTGWCSMSKTQPFYKSKAVPSTVFQEMMLRNLKKTSDTERASSQAISKTYRRTTTRRVKSLLSKISTLSLSRLRNVFKTESHMTSTISVTLRMTLTKLLDNLQQQSKARLVQIKQTLCLTFYLPKFLKFGNK